MALLIAGSSCTMLVGQFEGSGGDATAGRRSGEPATGQVGAGGAGGGAGGAGSGAGGSAGGAGGAPPGTTFIPAGTFGYLVEATEEFTPMTISHDFYLDTLEVSVDRFKAWVDGGQALPCATGTCSLDPGGPYEQTMVWHAAAWNAMAANDSYANGCENAKYTNTGAPTYTASDGGAYPMNCLNWYHAAAFCFSEGKRLPTQTEWQYAATGRGLNHWYPWGAEEPTDCSLAIWDSDKNNGKGNGKSNGCMFPKPGGSAPAGASHDGLLDMGGSVFEWAWDYDSDDFPTTPTEDYPGPTIPAWRSDRGGAWSRPQELLRTTYRHATPPEKAYADLGVRCAKTRLP
jgi:formylglycine-generating enzyme required for sulfatase activity